MNRNRSRNEVMVFDNPEFGKIRSIEIDGEPWLVGKDVARALGYERPTDTARKRVDDEDRGVAKIETPSGIQEMTIINESGLYSLIFSSQLPSAKKFKRWVTSEVLPAIRKTGSYSVGQEALSSQALEAISKRLGQVEKNITKIERETSYANYYLRLQMRSGYDKNWERRQAENLKAVSEFIGTDTKKILADIYREMEGRYGISLDEFCNDYKQVMNFHSCSTLSVVSFSLALREMFDAVIGEVMNICGIHADNDNGETPTIIQSAMMALRTRNIDSGSYTET